MYDLNHYEPLWGSWYADEFIGEGSFSRVYRLKREQSGVIKYSALKAVSIPNSENELQRAFDEMTFDVSVRNYFRHMTDIAAEEITIMNKLGDNEYIVMLLDSDIKEHADGFGSDILIRMELLENLSVYASNHMMSRAEIIKMGAHICRALEACAANGVVHNDIKTEKIFATEYGDFKLGGFGRARIAGKDADDDFHRRGATSCMSPDVFIREDYSEQADLYSLGLVMYRLLNKNRAPFTPDFPAPVKSYDRERAIERRMSGEAIPPIKGIDRKLNEILLKACAYKKDERYASALEMGKALESIL